MTVKSLFYENTTPLRLTSERACELVIDLWYYDFINGILVSNLITFEDFSRIKNYSKLALDITNVPSPAQAEHVKISLNLYKKTTAGVNRSPLNTTTYLDFTAFSSKPGHASTPPRAWITISLSRDAVGGTPGLASTQPRPNHDEAGPTAALSERIAHTVLAFAALSNAFASIPGRRSEATAAPTLVGAEHVHTALFTGRSAKCAFVHILFTPDALEARPTGALAAITVALVLGARWVAAQRVGLWNRFRWDAAVHIIEGDFEALGAGA